ncbi:MULTISPECIES: ABC transporter substrate-binding protein [Xanthobacter]|uniref:ABC transporter substrate-binding protein n=1 Tax=Xanthobacter flavus TaxID=281 RepID=A0A9W6CJZ5_XANFL|nr:MULTISPECIES: ABC transporter substrate-binding protein [Xanthobacter]MDR6332474.1 branched-chain amino acid transport system substrate-binding protein [Xanthobacter flavus]NMN56688.1 branched-chain amino acid transport system substrate-binding protein [Xanthobacter sp. SG618]UJX45083.1 ABC transporter substrate-binding protein [Xanthobacter sp. YC-JY1]GLI21775.1 ABC transporter substrate-binding protein [Xanthobacter flavus]
MKSRILMGLAILLAATTAASAQAPKTVKIGVLNDQSGAYADMGGVGSVVAAQLAIEDSGLKQKGWTIDVVSADHQNKADIAANVARGWFDVDGVDMITDVTNSAAALAVNQITRDKNKVMLASGPATSDLTGKACSPNTVHWTSDTWAFAHGTGQAIVKTGGDTWFFLTADYAFGQALERDTADVVEKNGGKVVGRVRVPLGTSDFSSFLVQAQGSKAKIVGLANSGADTTNSIKQAAEFGIVAGGQNLAGLLIYISDVHSMGLPVAQGLILTSPFYWDMNDKTRTFSQRFAEKMRGAKPTMVQAGVYSATLNYLKTVAELGDAKDGRKVVDAMKAKPIKDPLFGEGRIRADGRKIHDMYLFEVKKPAESKAPWDYYKLRATIPAEEAFRPLSQSECALLKS